ncbi:ABC transporter ATP-binding protein [Bradyrhizobium sp. DOA9]|uniref:ABC transporter ATP-binding protein n=1 Tax=Bradyrhizobium sp. DOA9 TaxID=1126627 RepID=UPI00046A2B11|nr:ABC transporter ATP-binding protein [Bradyrhizobium sp. DOA9]GAJ37557.1 high-affinity branched-chain amino acid transport ATP-binding protein BivF [Bradyrhizobium sp. DOA9]
MTDTLLELDNVHTHIGLYHILQGLGFRAQRNRITLLLGRNGAGKTTTLRTIMGLWPASAGRISFAGADIAGRSTSAISRLGIAYVPENMGIFPDLSVKQNMLLAARKAARAADMDQQRLEWIFGLFPAVHQFWNKPAGKLSGGQKQMVAMARAIVEPRQLLLIDEPSKGLAPAIVNNMAEAMLKLKESGASILLVEQNLQLAREVGDEVAIIDAGRLVHAGPADECFAREDLLKTHLGLTLCP